MPQEIRILQIADLLIENQASGDYISAAIQEYRRKIKPEEAPDYLVVCGNITKAGEPDQFKAAQTALNDVRNTLFQAAQFPHNRVFIVPGARDLPKLRGGERDSERFGQFYKDFYAGVPSSFEQFSPTEAIVRSLVDLTFIGICYHMEVDPEPAIASVIRELKRARARAIEYSVSMPVILVSSFPSMLSRDGSPREKQLAEHWGKEDELSLTSHLVGGPVTIIGREPFQANNHLTFGTGPVSHEERWSGRINVISIYPRDWWVPSEQEPEQRPEQGADGTRRKPVPEKIAATAHKWPDSITGPTPSHPLLGGQRVPTRRKSVYVLSKLEAELLKFLNDSRGIAVTGLPGKGKSQVFDHCASQSMRYACERLEQQSDREGLIDRLKALVDGNREAQPIVVIHDNVPRREPSRPQFDTAETIGQTLRNIAHELKVRGIYLFPYSVRRPMLPQGFGFHDLPPLDDKVMDAFKNLYSTRLPIKRSHLDRLINSYLGFAWLLVEEAKKIIEDRWPGARPIEADTSWTLILEALGSYDLWEVTQRFFAALRDEAGAGDLRDFLVMQFEDRLGADGPTERLLDPVEFTPADVCARLKEAPEPPRPRDVEAAAMTLSRARVLETVNNGFYRLLEPIPFLVHAVTSVIMPDASDASLQAAGTVFVSYSHADTEKVRPIVETLRQNSFQVWWDKDLIGGTIWEAGIDRELKNSKCILLLLSASSSNTDSYVHNEAQRRPENVIPVTLEENVEVPLSFVKLQYVSLVGWNGDTSSPEWKELIKAVMNKIQSAHKTAA